MCYAKPGPRCSGHTLTEYKEARAKTQAVIDEMDSLMTNVREESSSEEFVNATAAYESARDNEEAKRVEFMKTPKGIAILRKQGNHELAEIYSRDREEQIRLYHVEKANQELQSQNETPQTVEPVTLESLETPTDEDYERAYEVVGNHISSSPATSWNTVMGSIRRTKTTRAIYQDYVREEIQNNPVLKEKLDGTAKFNARRALPGRAFLAGVDHPDAEAFERIWRGESNGFSESMIRDNLNEHKSLLGQLERGEVPPSRIIGSGVRSPKTEARGYLQRQIKEGELALRTRGRSLSVNVGNVKYGANIAR